MATMTYDVLRDHDRTARGADARHAHAHLATLSLGVERGARTLNLKRGTESPDTVHSGPSTLVQPVQQC